MHGIYAHNGQNYAGIESPFLSSAVELKQRPLIAPLSNGNTSLFEVAGNIQVDGIKMLRLAIKSIMSCKNSSIDCIYIDQFRRCTKKCLIQTLVFLATGETKILRSCLKRGINAFVLSLLIGWIQILNITLDSAVTERV